LQISIQAVSTGEATPASAVKSELEHPSSADRKRESEARKGHQDVSAAYPRIKPRLDKILEGNHKPTGGPSG
jgi:hypothetical protein